MTARATRSEYEHSCPNGHIVDGAHKKCPRCGGRVVSTLIAREERVISWEGGHPSAEVLHKALWMTRNLSQSPARSRRPMDFTFPTDHRTNLSRTDILILTALADELTALRSNSGPWVKERVGDEGVHCYQTSAYHGLNISAVGMAGMGPVQAAVTTSSALRALNPAKVILTGICAGVGDGVKLGDVCVSEQIIDYDLGKVKAGEYQPRWRAYGSDAELVTLAKHFQPKSWATSITTPRPGGSSALPQVHFGPMLSGSKVVADGDMVQSLTETWTQAVGLEMEGGGVAAAADAYGARPPILLIKGVSDRADRKKNDKWRGYAAEAAATYAIQLLIELGSRNLAEGDRADSLRSRSAARQLATDFGGMTAGEFREVLLAAFDVSGLKSLCQDVDFDYEELPDRDRKSGFARSLVEASRRDQFQNDLVRAVSRAKPRLGIGVK